MTSGKASRDPCRVGGDTRGRPDGVEGANRQGVDKRVEVQIGVGNKSGPIFRRRGGQRDQTRGVGLERCTCVCARRTNGRVAGVLPAARRGRGLDGQPYVTARAGPCESPRIQEGVVALAQDDQKAPDGVAQGRVSAREQRGRLSGLSRFSLADAPPHRLSRAWRRCRYGQRPDNSMLLGRLKSRSRQPARWPQRTGRLCSLGG